MVRPTLVWVSSFVMSSAQHANEQKHAQQAKETKRKECGNSDWLHHYSESQSFRVAFSLLELRLTPDLPDWKLNYQCSQGWTGPGKLVLINQTQKTLIPPLVGCFSTISSTLGYLASILYCPKSIKWDQSHPQNTAQARSVDHAKSVPCLVRHSLHHWPTREVPSQFNDEETKHQKS